MTLVVDNRNALQDRPGMHIFIVGVSKYPHLPGGMGTPAPDSCGLRQLSSAALTAYKIYCWLLGRQNHFSAPLATCRLLLSPSHDEESIEPNLHSLADPCTLNNFLTEAQHWRDDAASSQNCITFFYAEWQTSLEMSEKCPLCHLKMSVPQGKIAVQPFF